MCYFTYYNRCVLFSVYYFHVCSYVVQVLGNHQSIKLEGIDFSLIFSFLVQNNSFHFIIGMAGLLDIFRASRAQL